MTNDIFITIAVTGFTVAFLHAAIPTHWLPFVLTARAQRWNHTKTLFITALAGTGHVLFTTVLGVLVVWFGIGLSNKVGPDIPVDRRRRVTLIRNLLSCVNSKEMDTGIITITMRTRQEGITNINMI
jgi:hypothetical protein